LMRLTGVGVTSEGILPHAPVLCQIENSTAAVLQSTESPACLAALVNLDEKRN
jgi:hypothetical protein